MTTEMGLSHDEAIGRIDGNDHVNAKFIREKMNLDNHKVLHFEEQPEMVEGFVDFLQKICEQESNSFESHNKSVAAMIINAFDDLDNKIRQSVD